MNKGKNFFESWNSVSNAYQAASTALEFWRRVNEQKWRNNIGSLFLLHSAESFIVNPHRGSYYDCIR